jgi:outer membrane protein assembly factor BamD
MRKIFLLTLTVITLFSCAKKEFYPKDVYYQGMKAYQEKNYEKAKDYLRKAIYKAENMTIEDVMNAKFALADSYYHEKMYVDAIVEFEEYISLYPTAPNIPEALYKLADSYLKVSPDYQRDLTYSEKAKDKAQDIIVNYPDSPYVEKAKEIIEKVKQKEAKHYFAIADLYYNLRKPYSAAFYYEYVLRKYPKYINKEEISYQLALNLINVKQQYADDINNYKEEIKQLEEKIKEEQDLEKKDILQNRKKILEDQLFTLEKRIKDSYIKGKDILKELSKGNDNYAKKAKQKLEQLD